MVSKGPGNAWESSQRWKSLCVCIYYLPALMPKIGIAKKPQICPWFPPKMWEEGGSKTKRGSRRSKHRKGNGAQEAGQDNGGKPIRAKNNTGKTLIRGRGKSDQTEHLERLKRLLELRCSLSWLNLLLLRPVLPVLAGGWCQGHLRLQRWMDVRRYDAVLGSRSP